MLMLIIVVVKTTLTMLRIIAANNSIMGKSRTPALGLYMKQLPKSLTLHWRSFSQCGCYNVTVAFAHKGCQYVDYG